MMAAQLPLCNSCANRRQGVLRALGVASANHVPQLLLLLLLLLACATALGAPQRQPPVWVDQGDNLYGPLVVFPDDQGGYSSASVLFGGTVTPMQVTSADEGRVYTRAIAFPGVSANETLPLPAGTFGPPLVVPGPYQYWIHQIAGGVSDTISTWLPVRLQGDLFAPFGHSAVALNQSHILVLFGGRQGTRGSNIVLQTTDKVHLVNVFTGTSLLLNCTSATNRLPAPRFFATTAITHNTTSGHTMVLAFGGCLRGTIEMCEEATNDTWVFVVESQSWALLDTKRTEAQPQPVLPRYYAAASVDPSDRRVKMFFGYKNCSTSFACDVACDAWSLNLESLVWESLPPVPSQACITTGNGTAISVFASWKGIGIGSGASRNQASALWNGTAWTLLATMDSLLTYGSPGPSGSIFSQFLLVDEPVYDSPIYQPQESILFVGDGVLQPSCVGWWCAPSIWRFLPSSAPSTNACHGTRWLSPSCWTPTVSWTKVPTPLRWDMGTQAGAVVGQFVVYNVGWLFDLLSSRWFFRPLKSTAFYNDLSQTRFAAGNASCYLTAVNRTESREMWMACARDFLNVGKDPFQKVTMTIRGANLHDGAGLQWPNLAGYPCVALDSKSSEVYVFAWSDATFSKLQLWLLDVNSLAWRLLTSNFPEAYSTLDMAATVIHLDHSAQPILLTYFAFPRLVSAFQYHPKPKWFNVTEIGQIPLTPRTIPFALQVYPAGNTGVLASGLVPADMVVSGFQFSASAQCMGSDLSADDPRSSTCSTDSEKIVLLWSELPPSSDAPQSAGGLTVEFSGCLAASASLVVSVPAVSSKATLYVYTSASCAPGTFAKNTTVSTASNAAAQRNPAEPDIRGLDCQICPSGSYASEWNTTGACTPCPDGLTTPTLVRDSAGACSRCVVDQCSGHGHCNVLIQPQGGPAPQCLCHFGFSGSRCETPWIFYAAGGAAGVLLLLACVLVAVRRWRKFRWHLIHRSRDLEERTGLLEQELETQRNSDRVDIAELTRLRPLGKGGFGVVTLCRFRGELVALKEPTEASFQLSADVTEESFARDLEALKHVRHRNVIQYIGWGLRPARADEESSSRPFLVLEYCERGDLGSILRSDEPLTAAQRISFCHQAAAGMRYLHFYQPPFIHRDFKTDNLLVSEAWVVKITDFGEARRLLTGEQQGEGDRAAMLAGGVNGGDERRYMTHGVGTPCYMAPEVLERQEYDASVDVYSFGIAAWEIAARRRPYEDIGYLRLATHVVEGGRPEPVDAGGPEFPAAFYKLMQRCWAGMPAARPSFVEVEDALASIILMDGGSD